LCKGKGKGEGKGKGKIHPITDHAVPDRVLTDAAAICNFETQNPPQNI